MLMSRLLLLASWLLLSSGGPAKAADQEFAFPDTALTFHRVQLTLENGAMHRSDLARFGEGRAILYEYRAKDVDALIRPRTEEVTHSLDMSEISRVEVEKNFASKGSGWGAFAGIATFGVLLIAYANEPRDSSPDAEGIMAGVTFFGLSGAAIGALVGAGIPRWETVYDPAAGVPLTPTAGYERGVGYRLSKEDDDDAAGRSGGQ